MGSNKLAVLGGEPVVPELQSYRSIGNKEVEAVKSVLESQCESWPRISEQP